MFLCDRKSNKKTITCFRIICQARLFCNDLSVLYSVYMKSKDSLFVDKKILFSHLDSSMNLTGHPANTIRIQPSFLVGAFNLRPCIKFRLRKVLLFVCFWRFCSAKCEATKLLGINASVFFRNLEIFLLLQDYTIFRFFFLALNAANIHIPSTSR